MLGSNKAGEAKHDNHGIDRGTSLQITDIQNLKRKMASSWLRLRMQYLGGIRLSRATVGLGLLALTYILFQWVKGPSKGIIRYKDVPINHQMSYQEIDDYIYAMQDTRPKNCRVDHKDFLAKAQASVSIVVDFHNAEFYNLKLTLESILRHTSAYLFKEIVLLDDGSDHDAIRQHAADILEANKYAKVRAYRSEKFQGRGLTRYKASQVAEGDILVFVSSDVVVNVGWLEPLLVGVLENTNRILVPHEDNFLDNKRFFQTDDNLLSTFSWPLNTVYMESKETSKYLMTPVMRGEVVAVAKTFLDSIANYDHGMKEGGGHDFELSLRTWLCGGEILTTVCSRVATHHALKSPAVTNHVNFRRIVELWLGDHKDTAYKQGMVLGDLTADEQLDVNIRAHYILKKKHMQCKPIQWYLDNIITNALPPLAEMVHFGKLKVSSAYCAKLSKETGNDLTLVLCRPYLYDQSMTFTLDKSGSIRIGELCFMSTSSTSKVLLTQCQVENTLQLWKYSDTGLITSQVFPESCLTQVTTHNTRTRSHEHSIHISPCKSGDNEKQIWAFINY